MHLRSVRERVFQVICFEVGGLLLVVPLYAMVFRVKAEEGLIVLVSLSLAVMLWSAVHNTVFDIIDFSLTGRVASDRPHGLRILHGILHEVSALIVTCPLLVWVGGHSWLEALAVDVALSVVYTVYAYGFHIVFDRLRPVRR